MIVGDLFGKLEVRDKYLMLVDLSYGLGSEYEGRFLNKYGTRGCLYRATLLCCRTSDFIIQFCPGSSLGLQNVWRKGLTPNFAEIMLNVEEKAPKGNEVNANIYIFVA